MWQLIINTNFSNYCHETTIYIVYRDVKMYYHLLSNEADMVPNGIGTRWFCSLQLIGWLSVSSLAPGRFGTQFYIVLSAWWRHQIETFYALLAICAGNSPVPGEFPTQRPVTRGFDVFFDLRLNKPLSKQWWCWWFETLSRPLWRHCNEHVIWVRSRTSGCLVTWFCYQLIAKPGNKTAAVSWPDPYVHDHLIQIYFTIWRH